MLAIPLWLLYEMGVIIAALLVRNRSVTPPASDYQPMTDAEMDAELDRIEAGQK
jgi:sec-independent protein translocase protein TatC